MTIKRVVFTLIAAIVLCILLSCNGGSTEIGNARSGITGKVTENSTAATVASVSLVEEHFIPGADTTGKVFTTETDCSGIFRFSDIPQGTYYLNAEKGEKLLLDGPFTVESQRVDLLQHQLHQASVISLTVDDTAAVTTVYIKGTVKPYEVKAGSVELPFVPQGRVTIQGYNRDIAENTPVKPAVTITVSEATRMAASFTNTPPVFTALPQSVRHVIDADSRSYSYQLTAQDAENDTLRYMLIFGPGGMNVESASGLVTWLPKTGVASGTYGVTVEVADSRGATNRTSWEVILADGRFTLDGVSQEYHGEAGKTYMIYAGQTAGINAYRFAWGDGDTSVWQKQSSAAHSWKSEGMFPLSVQVQNSSDGGISAWSDPVTVVILGVSVDTVAPVLQIDDTILYVKIGTPFEQPAYSAYDFYDEREVDVTVSGSIDVNAAGIYILRYTAVDLSGNQAVCEQRVVVYDPAAPPDMTEPVIHLLGADTIFLNDSVTIERFKAGYVEPGYEAIDDVDGDVTARVKASDIVQLSQGIFYIEYTVTDNAGNVAKPVRRFIITTLYPPVIILVHGDSVVQQQVNMPWVEPGFAVTDVQDGTIPNSKVTVDSADLVSHLAIPGTYQVIYQVANSLGLTTAKVRYVRVVDASGEYADSGKILLLGKNPDTVLIGSGQYSDPGYRAFDAEENDITERVVVTGTVTMEKLGKNSIVYKVSDSTGYQLSTIRTVYVVADTLIKNLLTKYDVPSPDPFPTVNGRWTATAYSGDTTGLMRVKTVAIMWDLEARRLDTLRFEIEGMSTFIDLDSVKHTLSSPAPQILFDSAHSTGAPRLDKKVYVTMDGGIMIWVAADGSFAIEWTREN